MRPKKRKKEKRNIDCAKGGNACQHQGIVDERQSVVLCPPPRHVNRAGVEGGNGKHVCGLAGVSGVLLAIVRVAWVGASVHMLLVLQVVKSCLWFCK